MSAGALHLQFDAAAKIDVTVDIVAYFENMPTRERLAYQTWTDNEFWESDRQGNQNAWEKPVAYLNGDLNQSVEVHASSPRGLVSDVSELDMWETPRVRGAKVWTEAHYWQLLAAVPWLAALDRATSGKTEEEIAEDESRLPTAYDVPLFSEAGAAR